MTITELLASIRALSDVRVDLDHDFGTAACPLCDDDSPAVVRVYGEPAARHLYPVELVEVCAVHAVATAARALSEQDEYSRSPIRIEVAA